MRMVSLGRACEVAFQIRMHSDKIDSDFFDWLITPFDGLMAALRSNLDGLLEADELYLQNDKNFVNNKKTGIQYGHVFMRDENHNIPDNFLDDLPRVRNKFDYLKEKFFSNAKSEDPICFIRRDISSIQAKILEEQIEAMFPSLDFKLACVNAEDVGLSDAKSPRVIDLRIVNGAHDGLGFPESWAEALTGAGLTTKPFVKTKEDIVIPFH